MRYILGAALLAVAVYCGQATAQGTETFELERLRPVDEAPQRPDFKQFRDDLLQIIEDRNTEALLSHVDPEIKVDFGGATGIADFKKTWELNATPQLSRLWVELAQVLDMGGAFQETGDEELFVAPYVYAKFPEDFDPFEFAVITGENVFIRNEPFVDAVAIGQLSYEIVRLVLAFGEETVNATIGGETWPWQKVQTYEGKVGYVYGKYVRSPVGYRAGFEKIDDAWKLTFFVAGD